MGAKPVVLVVDDEPGIGEVIRRFAERAGCEVVTSPGGREALEHLRTSRADLALVDLRLPEIGGLEVLRAIRQIDPHCQVVLMTGHATIESAVEAVKLGAVDYLSKPLDFGRLGQILATVRDEIERRKELLAAEGELARRLEFEGMIGRSAVMQELFGFIRRLAPHVRTVLISGETGTGKELVARALHRLGPRRDRRFVTVNCSAVVESLFESELFGHVRGAFTGAAESKPGLFELADGGTLFLDEVGELPLAVQAKLLRVLELGELTRVGSLTPKRVDVHIIAATNRQLEQEVARGAFRRDLFYRLNIVEIRLPALRERREDIPYLTAAFIREFAARLGKGLMGITPAAERLLTSASWPGNVRELRNVLERACILADGPFLTDREIVAAMPPEPGEAVIPSEPAGEVPAGPPACREEQSLAEVEREHILRALERCGGNKKRAAALLGLSRRALYRRLERHALAHTISRRLAHVRSLESGVGAAPAGREG